jgi:hypothetical protein
VWLSKHSSSGIEEILNMDIELFEDCLVAAQNIWKEEIKIPQLVIIKGLSKEDSDGR